MGKNPKKVMKREAQRSQSAPYMSSRELLAEADRKLAERGINAGYTDDVEVVAYDEKEQEEFNKMMDDLTRKSHSKDDVVRAEAKALMSEMMFYEKEKTERYLHEQASRAKMPSKDKVKAKHEAIAQARRAEDGKFHEAMGVKEAVDREMGRPSKKAPVRRQTAQIIRKSKGYNE